MEGRCARHRPPEMRSGGLARGREEGLSQTARVEAAERLRAAGQVVVEVRQADRRVLDEDRLDLLAGRLLRVDADGLLEVGERGVERRRAVLGRVPDALRLQRRVEVDIRGPAVAVVDD